MHLASELYWLTLTASFTLLLVFPYAFVRIRHIGFLRLLTNPLPGDDPFDEAWAHRAYRAHMNAIENLVVFAPLAIAVTITNSANEITAMACAVYFWARVVYAPLYYFDVPYLKTTAWMIGLIATLTLGFELLNN